MSGPSAPGRGPRRSWLCTMSAASSLDGSLGTTCKLTQGAAPLCCCVLDLPAMPVRTPHAMAPAVRCLPAACSQAACSPFCVSPKDCRRLLPAQRVAASPGCMLGVRWLCGWGSVGPSSPVQAYRAGPGVQPVGGSDLQERPGSSPARAAAPSCTSPPAPEPQAPPGLPVLGPAPDLPGLGPAPRVPVLRQALQRPHQHPRQLRAARQGSAGPAGRGQSQEPVHRRPAAPRTGAGAAGPARAAERLRQACQAGAVPKRQQAWQIGPSQAATTPQASQVAPCIANSAFALLVCS